MLRSAIILLLVCGLASPLAAARLTDALGREVTVPDRPQRIVSLVPSVTEVLFALGAGDRLAGVTRFCDYPPAARSKPQVGSYAEPGLEEIALRRPDLVIAAADMADPALLARLEALEVPVYIVYPRDIDTTLATFRALGALVGEPARGERLAADLTRAVERISAATAALPRPRVLLSVEITPLTVAGPQTLAADLVRTAGGRNVVPPGPGRYPTWGIEAVLAADPDVILVSPHPGQPDPARFFAPWPELKAVREGRVVTIEPDWIHRPGPRLARGLAALAEALHGIEIEPGETP